MTVEVVTTQAGLSYLKCTCDRSAIRRRIIANGNQIYALQCLDCGRQIRAVSKNAPEILEMPERMPFDETLQQQWQDRHKAHIEIQMRGRDAERKRKDTEWWQWYKAYLQTTAWRLKRQAVMARANNWCEGCRAREAVQVHHLTYDHVGNEFLFELVAVCLDCHSRLHAEADYDA